MRTEAAGHRELARYVAPASTKIVVDPYLHGDNGIHLGLPQSPVTLADLVDADIVLVTHAGYDHRAKAIDIAQAGLATLVCGNPRRVTRQPHRDNRVRRRVSLA
jgi:L-ascorbate metabolism protein UlaG (beta-lactamase superfamily)